MHEISDNACSTELLLENENPSSNDIWNQQPKTGKQNSTLNKIIPSGPQSHTLKVPESVLTPDYSKALITEHIDSFPEGEVSLFVPK